MEGSLKDTVRQQGTCKYHQEGAAHSARGTNSGREGGGGGGRGEGGRSSVMVRS